MTASELQRIATRLGNQCYVRHWLQWDLIRQEPSIMAIQLLDRDVEGRLRPVQARDLDRLGFRWDEDKQMYFIDRTNEDDSPYR